MKFAISSRFGVLENIREGREHLGIDLAMPQDTPLRSFCDGVVEKVMNFGSNNIGKGIIIKTKDGIRYVYGHMDEIDVHQGQTVNSGTLLGLSGNTGHSTGPHLHFAEMVNGQYVDPSNVIDKVDGMAGISAVKGLHETVESNSPGWLSNLASKLNIEDQIEDHVRDLTQHAVMGALSAAGIVFMHSLYAIVLIGSGILIVMRTLGFQHRWLKPSVLVGGYVLLRFLFGGGGE